MDQSATNLTNPKFRVGRRKLERTYYKEQTQKTHFDFLIFIYTFIPITFFTIIIWSLGLNYSHTFINFMHRIIIIKRTIMLMRIF